MKEVVESLCTKKERVARNHLPESWDRQSGAASVEAIESDSSASGICFHEVLP